MSNKVFVLFTMIFCHILDDYCLQGILASLKQKKYWEENAPQKLYKNDYKMALFMHSFSWSFMIMLPIHIATNFNTSIHFTIFWLGYNILMHYYIDDLKANKFKINLIQDQLIHLIQIIITWFTYILVEV